MKTLTGIFVLLITTSLFGQIPQEGKQAAQTITGQEIKAHIRFLANDALLGRSPGTPGYKAAAAYMASQMELTGLKPGGDENSYYQQVKLETTTPKHSGSLIIKQGKEEHSMDYGKDFSLINNPIGKIGFSGDIVFGGFGIEAAKFGMKDLSSVDVKDKLVIVISRLSDEVPFEINLKYGRGNDRYRDLKKRGAKGAIVYIKPERQEGIPLERYIAYWSGTKRGIPEAGLDDFPIIFANWNTINKLFESKNYKVADYLEGKKTTAKFKLKATAELKLDLDYDKETIETPNVIGVLEGSDPQLKNEYVVYTAHLDHVGVGKPVEGDSIYNGAYDNASGSSILLEMAEAYTSMDPAPKRSIMFIALTAEEMGLLGSEYFVNFPTVPLESIVANFNTDMFLMEKGIDPVVALGKEYSEIGDYVKEVCDYMKVSTISDPLPEERIYTRSDHYNFAKKGIPALFLINDYIKPEEEGGQGNVNFVWLNSIYHSPLDNFKENADYASGVKYAQINFLTGYMVAQKEERVKWTIDFPID